MNKAEFVLEFGKVLAMAKPNLVSCEYVRGKELFENYQETTFYKVAHDVILDDDEYVVVTCENGYQYFVNVHADSLGAIILDVIKKVIDK